jgi:hypothetical protein
MTANTLQGNTCQGSWRISPSTLLTFGRRRRWSSVAAVLS